MKVTMKGLTGIIGLFVVLMVVPAFSKEISKAASESVAIGLSQALEQQVVNLHTKILKTKHAFSDSKKITDLQLLMYKPTEYEREAARMKKQCGDINAAIIVIEDLFTVAQRLQLIESYMTRNIKKDTEKIYVKDFRDIEFALRDVQPKMRNVSSTLGYQSTHSPTYSVGLLPNIKSIKGISSRVNEQAHIVIYDSLEHMQICLEAFISFITQYSGDNNVENNYIL